MRIVFGAAAALAMVLFVACSGSGPTGSGAACTVDTDCGEPRVCRGGLCSDPSSNGSSGSSGSSGTSGTSVPPSPESDASTPTIYCGSASPSSCVCGHTTSYGNAGASCGSSTVTAPGLCCAQPGWPTSSSCTCYQLACDQYSSDTCICGAAGTLLHPVGSCSPPTGGVCCMGSGAAGSQLCACHKNLTQCPSGEQNVGSCSVAAIGCTESTKVAACQ